MRIALLSAKSILWAYLTWILLFLATSYDPSDPAGFDPPFFLFALDWVNLFIHEAGHFVFRIFGQWMHMFGGSLFQVLVPLALTIVSFRQSPSHATLPLYWTGESMVNLSVYIADAPYKQLKLIAKGSGPRLELAARGQSRGCRPALDRCVRTRNPAVRRGNRRRHRLFGPGVQR